MRHVEPATLAGVRVLVVEDHDAKPNVLVSDIAMPGEHGDSFIQTVRALAPERGGRVPARLAERL